MIWVGVFMYVAVKKKKKRPKILIAVLLCLVLIIGLFFISDRHFRGVINGLAVSRAETILIDSANKAASEVFSNKNITYTDIVKLSKNEDGTVTALETDVGLLNSLKADVSLLISQKIDNDSLFNLKIPIGTLIGNEFTMGRGPNITYKMQLTATAVTNFHSRFYSAGINQVLHQITVNVKMNGHIINPWYKSNFSVQTSLIVAQTVIVGITPDSFTNVMESEPDNIAEDIFNFSMN